MVDPYAQWLIADFSHWGVYLHESQCYLGRCYIWLKRSDVIDIMDITAQEREQLWMIGNLLKKALGVLFAPDLYNWAALANVAAHCHVHLIPRYQALRTLDGYVFTDERWGQNYAPYDANDNAPESVRLRLRELIATRLKLEHEYEDSPERGNKAQTWLHRQPRCVRWCLWRFYQRTKVAPTFRFWDFKEFVGSGGVVRPQSWQSVSRHLRALGWLAVTGHGPGSRWQWLHTDLTEADFTLESSPLRGGKLT